MEMTEAEMRSWLIRVGWNVVGCDAEDDVWTNPARAHRGDSYTFEQAMRHYIAATDGQQLARHLQPRDVWLQPGMQALEVVGVTHVPAADLVLIEAAGLDNLGNRKLFWRTEPAQRVLTIRRGASCLLG